MPHWRKPLQPRNEAWDEAASALLVLVLIGFAVALFAAVCRT